MLLLKPVAAAAMLICAPLVATAQTSVDIVQIWQNFIASGAAEKACGPGGEKPSDHFLANLTMVTIRATQALQERYPNVPAPELKSKIAAIPNMIDNKVQAEVKANGCGSPKIQQLLAMYRMHSAMKF